LSFYKPASVAVKLGRRDSNLHPALDNVQRGDDEVGDAAREEPAQAAEGVKLVAPQFAGISTK
jgi:hypothetical protein